jgi:hypothetical protein
MEVEAEVVVSVDDEEEGDCMHKFRIEEKERS